MIVPTLVNEAGGWKARLELRNPASSTNVATLDTAAVSSLLVKETAHELMPAAAQGIRSYFVSVGPWRQRVTGWMAATLRRQPLASSPRLRTLDAARAFEEALDAYGRLEYAAAASALTDAARLDPRSPMIRAWLSRVLLLMRRQDEAREAGDEAARLLSTSTPPDLRSFVEATAAEARGDFDIALREYSQMAEAFAGDADAQLELAGYQERRGMSAAAVASYRRALAIDPGVIPAHVALCRLYNRVNEPATALLEARAALTEY
jgi:tetratricopeptide (TPR) repeat protein